MRIEVLGSGGAIATPRPWCDCGLCTDARRDGSRNARTGPSVFVHGPDVLVDTPEESRLQLARGTTPPPAAVLYSHWHPDHTAGRRVFEAGFDFRGWPPDAKRNRRTLVYAPDKVARDFQEWLGIAQQFEYLEQRLRVVALHEIADGDAVHVGGMQITPIELAVGYVYAFLFEGGGRRALVAMDELVDWDPPDLGPLDLAYLPLGIFEYHPLTGERAIHPEHPLLRLEATYERTMTVVRALDARRVVLSHVEHMDGLTHDDLTRLGERDGWEPAYDGMLVDL